MYEDYRYINDVVSVLLATSALSAPEQHVHPRASLQVQAHSIAHAAQQPVALSNAASRAAPVSMAYHCRLTASGARCEAFGMSSAADVSMRNTRGAPRTQATGLARSPSGCAAAARWARGSIACLRAYQIASRAEASTPCAHAEFAHDDSTGIQPSLRWHVRFSHGATSSQLKRREFARAWAITACACAAWAIALAYATFFCWRLMARCRRLYARFARQAKQSGEWAGDDTAVEPCKPLRAAKQDDYHSSVPAASHDEQTSPLVLSAYLKH